VDLKKVFIKWKMDVHIASSWVNTPILFLALASFIYLSVSFINTNLHYWQFFIICIIVFLPLYKLIGKAIIKTKLYGGERIYDALINPYSYTELTPKERLLINANLVSLEANVLTLKASMEFMKKSHPNSFTVYLEHDYNIAIFTLQKICSDLKQLLKE